MIAIVAGFLGVLGRRPTGTGASHLRDVTAAQVRSPITVRKLPAARYCIPPRGEPVRCEGKAPNGYSVYPGTRSHHLLVEVSWVARVAADGRHSVYEFFYHEPCASGGGTCYLSGIAAPGRAVHAGARLRDWFLAASAGTFTVNVGFVANVDPRGLNQESNQPMQIPGSVLVGRTTFTVR